MKILLTGAQGQIGCEFPGCANALNRNIELIGVGRNELNITKMQEVEQVVDSVQPDIVINAAAYTAVDKAEEESELAFAVNRDGATNVAKVCSTHDVPLIHISTDYVFDGSKQGEYVETDDANPINVYGKSKLQGEQRIQSELEKHIILRTSWVFGPYGRNFVYSIVRLARERSELSIVSDQMGCPTSAASIANAILNVCNVIVGGDKVEWGVYHYCDSPKTNWFEFGKAIVESTRYSQPYKLEQLKPISTTEFPTIAVRPENSVLNCHKIYGQFGIAQQPWAEGLSNMINHPQFKVLTN